MLSAAKNPVDAGASRDRLGSFAALRTTIGETANAVLRRLSRAAVAVLNGLIWIYQHTVSPALAVAAPTCGCRFAPTCSHYAQDALREHGVFLGLALTARRLAKCGPWHPGGLDPVPPSASLRRTGPRGKFACTKVISSAASEQSPFAYR